MPKLVKPRTEDGWLTQVGPWLARTLYTLALWCAQPLLRRKLAQRGQREPGYLAVPQERFGYYGDDVPTGQGWVWVHAVSLGETRAAAILVRALRERMPQMRLLLTHGTATGRAEGRALLQPGDVQVWQPWDTPAAVRRFLQRFVPAVGVLMETEVWPQMVALCRQQAVPLVLVNARLNAKSLRQAQRLAWLARPAYGALAAVWAQSQADAQRLQALGAPVQGVFGNLKFDATPDAAQQRQGKAWRAALGRPVLVLASSREGEEAELLQVLRHGKAPVQWLIVPRHPQRFDEVAALVQAQGLSLSRRSTWGHAPDVPPPLADVWLGDSLGEMALYYSLSDAALLGGSFALLGGQNLIEAAACACPLVMGPSVFNFQEAANLALQAGAACGAESMAQACAMAQALVLDPQRHAQAATAAAHFAAAHRGAAARTAEAVLALL